jgi:hypothetical protein
MKKLFFIILLSILPSLLYPQGSAGSKSIYETRYVVDMPTAGVLSRGAISAYALFFTQGGVMVYLDAAPFDNFNFGLSFSGTNILGEGPIEFQKIPGINIKWRIIDETFLTPAILVGFTNQGRGKYYKSYERFQTLFPGVYGAVSKNFKWFMGSFSLHGGLNYSWEQPTGRYYPNIYAGFEHSIGPNGSVQIEMNPNFSDTDGKIMVHNSLLNAALRWSVTKGLTLELIFRDLLNNTRNADGFERWIGIEYINSF